MPCLLTPLLHGAGLVDTGDGIEKKKEHKEQKEGNEREKERVRERGWSPPFPRGWWAAGAESQGSEVEHKGVVAVLSAYWKLFWVLPFPTSAEEKPAS